MQISSSIDNFRECHELTIYADLWMQFPGEKELLKEIDDHKRRCQVCQENNKAVEAWREWRSENGIPVAEEIL